VCFKPCLSQGTPYPCRVAGFHGRESVAVEARNGCAIGIAHGRKRGLATVMHRFNPGRGLKLSVSANSPHPRPVYGNNQVRKQSVNTDWQWIQSSMTAPRQRSWIVRRQSAVVDFPRTRIGQGHDLSPVPHRQRIVPVPASPRPTRCRPISRFTFNPFRFMTTFDPAEVRQAVAEFTPRRPQKFQVVEKSLPAVTNARIVPVRFTSRALVTSLHLQDSNKSGGLDSLRPSECSAA